MSPQTLNYTNLLLVITVPLFISQLPILYLRPMLLSIISDLCGHPMRAEFWVRGAALLSSLGSLILALIFGMDSIRALIVASLLGSFASVAFVVNAIWKSTPRPPVALGNRTS